MKPAQTRTSLIELTHFAGIGVFTVCVLYALFRLYFRSPAEHYDLFTTSARMLWAGDSPYGRDFNPIGRWFYSPSCGMLFFAFFGLFPKLIGMSLYVASSLALFLWGLKSWCGLLRIKNWGLVLGLISPQVMGAIWATKIEMFSTGALLLSSYFLLNTALDTSIPLLRRRVTELVCLVGLGAIADWKFQTMPATLLLLLIFGIYFRKWLYSVIFILSTIGFKLLPFLWFQKAEVFNMYQVLGEDLDAFMRAALYSFDNIFNFIHSSLRITIPFSSVFWITGIVAGLMAVFIFLLCLFHRKSRDTVVAIGLLCLCLGCAFSVLMNPLSQNNAFIQLTPIVVAMVFCIDKLKNQSRFALYVAGSIGWGILALAYSDLFTTVLRPLTLKPFGAAVLLVVASEALLRVLQTDPLECS